MIPGTGCHSSGYTVHVLTCLRSQHTNYVEVEILGFTLFQIKAATLMAETESVVSLCEVPRLYTLKAN